MAPDLLLATSTPALAALQRMTDSVPIVFVQVSDPIGDGFVASLARPGGRITGLTNFEPTMGGKWLEVLKEIAPGIVRVGLLFNPQTSPGGGSFYSRQIEAAAATFAMQPLPMPLRNATEIEPAIIEFARNSNSGLVILSDPFVVTHRELVMGLAARHRLPAIYPFRYIARAGGLVSYGVDIGDSYRRVATYVDRILRGAKPADLPIEAPTKFELVINLKTAKALGLDVPPSLLARADEVIE
jgi:putative ABC transport system substrate-binding protein